MKIAARAAALLLVVAPLAAACHSIDRDVYAHGPVPLAVLPLREPVTYTAGPNANQVVPAEHGLLGSYFNGADYVQPNYNERLDHQQVDPQVDFTWDASDTNPVIPAADGGIDHNDGDFRLPDHWPIWSIVWEGYLLVPADGTYGLRLHLNNGGWLEMKDASGALTTVIDCHGGTSFEGDCSATADLAAGPQYIRISYYNNAPPGADAILSWEAVGASDFAVVPSDALCTQSVPHCEAQARLVMFVHGIGGNFRTPGFDPLVTTLQRRLGTRLALFAYSEDLGRLSADSGTCDVAEPAVPPEDWHGLPHLLPVPDPGPICDSQDDVAVNAVLLDEEVKRQAAQEGATKVTIVSNSMGGAITRAFLAYAGATGSHSLDLVDRVVFLQGAQQGSYLLAIDEASREDPVLAPVGRAIEQKANDSLGLDAGRPAETQLRPQSDLYEYVNQPGNVPEAIDYTNVASDIHVVALVGLGLFAIPMVIPTVGDYVILPGSDDPAALPWLGGERFVPRALAPGHTAVQWILSRTDFVTLDPPTVDLPDLKAEPETHFGLGQGGATDAIRVDVGGASQTLTNALLLRILGPGGS
ncbi:MAG: hypothetical protein KGJ98_10115 [Chloroflexota bacterium]|nr:hypothetical protein [Chloroflexota bacterium]